MSSLGPPPVEPPFPIGLVTSAPPRPFAEIDKLLREITDPTKERTEPEATPEVTIDAEVMEAVSRELAGELKRAQEDAAQGERREPYQGPEVPALKRMVAKRDNQIRLHKIATARWKGIAEDAQANFEHEAGIAHENVGHMEARIKSLEGDLKTALEGWETERVAIAAGPLTRSQRAFKLLSPVGRFIKHHLKFTWDLMPSRMTWVPTAILSAIAFGICKSIEHGGLETRGGDPSPPVAVNVVIQRLGVTAGVVVAIALVVLAVVVGWFMENGYYHNNADDAAKTGLGVVISWIVAAMAMPYLLTL